MKNSLFHDLVHEARRKLREHHEFSIKYGGLLSKEQKELFKKDFCAMVDSLPEYNGNGYKFPE